MDYLYKEKTSKSHGMLKTYVYVEKTYELQWHPSFAYTECLPYWVAYIKNSEIQYSSCLKIKPRWMYDMKSTLKSFKLSEVMLPGIHENGYIGNIAHPVFRPTEMKWSTFNGMDVWNLLIYGVRYFDFRLYCDNNTKKIRVLSGNVPSTDFSEILDSLSRFIYSTQEIVILNLSWLDSSITSDKGLTQILIKELKEKLGDIAIYRNKAPDPKLEDLWKTNTRVLIICPESIDAEFIWDPTLASMFIKPNLEDFLITLASSMGLTTGIIDKNLTYDQFIKQAGTYKDFPQLSTSLLRTQRDWCSKINILSTDFILSTDVVAISIEVNNRFNKSKLLNSILFYLIKLGL